MKALNNFLAATSSAAGAEAITIGRQFGLDPAVMTDVINASTGRSFTSENLIKQQVLSGTFATGFALGLLAKDVGIAADLARQIGVDAPIGRLVERAVERGARRRRRRAGPFAGLGALARRAPHARPRNERRRAAPYDGPIMLAGFSAVTM